MLDTLIPTIGNAVEAHIALHDPSMPGWRYLGSGSYRSVYLSPTGVVYKVNDGGPFGYGDNESEWENYLRISALDLPDWLRVPTMCLYGDVMAAQYIDSPKLEWCTFNACLCGGIWKGTCQVYLHDEVNALLDISDMHHDNLIPVPSPNGYVWYAIDLGH